MRIQAIINPKIQIIPKVYAYIVPHYPPREGWVKIGYTNRDVEKRISEQSRTIGVQTKTLWHYVARFNSGEYFKDYEFHQYLGLNGIPREEGLEWFNFGIGNERHSEYLFKEFTFKNYSEVQKTQKLTYVLRKEQEEAVAKTLSYARANPEGEFLWNAKPRFGKTLSAYDFARRLNARNVLIVTNRPAIANSWFDDFEKFIAWQTKYKFVSETDSLKGRKTLTRQEFISYLEVDPEAAQIAFLSLQDLKGSVYHGGDYEKLRWISNITWDLLIIDEAHEGVDTFKTSQAFESIKREFTLHLSGTPFKAIAKGDFTDEQIYNWSYEDEQDAKESWDQETNNPYEELPRLNMLTYQMSMMIAEEVNKGALIDGEEKDYAFDLNEFFSTKQNGEFKYEEDVNKWLDTLTTNEKYPFSTEELRHELKHTFWILGRVASVKALAKLLKRHPVFKDYCVVVAAGDGQIDSMVVNENSLKRVRDAIMTNDKTITLSVGQLTTGVTIPEWSAVLMLSNMQSASLYMQAAFRAQNPHTWVEDKNGEEVVYQKQNSYVFDFAPERTLTIFDEFANNLSTKTSGGGGTSQDRKNNIARLLNFFPVIGEDTNGVMKELNVNDVLTIPRRIKATEVVRRGFMSNLLFANVSGIFGAPQIVLETLSKLNPESQGKTVSKKDINTMGIKVDSDGDVVVNDELVINQTEAILGGKLYDISAVIPVDKEQLSRQKIIKDISKSLIDSTSITKLTEKAREVTGATLKETQKFVKDLEQEISQKVETNLTLTHIELDEAKTEYTELIAEAETQEEVEKLNLNLVERKDFIWNNLKKIIEKETAELIEEKNKEFVKDQERIKENRKKSSVEEDVRSHLRGFARTIPSFIMSYGNSDLRLDNFDKYVPSNVFEEVTGITISQFIFLRDGGPYVENGEERHFDGGLFDEIVFNESVQEFLRKKIELANYFEDHEEDIFDYIPPQKTNQIFTPKSIVRRMVKELESENPGIFDDSRKTFVDLYMKSGLYITEIVKRLFNSEQIKREIPDDKERIKHILENQVYGFAPTEIIYNIAINFIFGELEEDVSRKNFLQIDTTTYVKEGNIQELIDKSFG